MDNVGPLLNEVGAQVIEDTEKAECPGFGQDRDNFTRIQEGAQPGGLTLPVQTEQDIPSREPSCWVPVGRSWGRELSRGSEAQAVVQSGRAAFWVMRFVLCILLICIVVVTVPFVCCSVKLPLSRPTSFLLFVSILLLTPAGGGVAAWCFCCQPQPNRNRELLDAFFASDFTAKAGPQVSQSLEVREKTQRKEDLPLVEEDHVRDH